MGQALAGIVTLVTVLLFTQPSLAGGDDHRALQFLLDKGIITQQEYDQAVEEEQRAKVDEEQRVKQATAITKNGLQVKLGGFAEMDFVGDNTQSFAEIIGSRPVLHSNTVGGEIASFLPARGAVGSRSMCEPQSGMVSSPDISPRLIFWGTNRRSAPPECLSSRR